MKGGYILLFSCNAYQFIKMIKPEKWQQTDPTDPHSSSCDAENSIFCKQELISKTFLAKQRNLYMPDFQNFYHFSNTSGRLNLLLEPHHRKGGLSSSTIWSAMPDFLSTMAFLYSLSLTFKGLASFSFIFLFTFVWKIRFCYKRLQQ